MNSNNIFIFIAVMSTLLTCLLGAASVYLGNLVLLMATVVTAALTLVAVREIE